MTFKTVAAAALMLVSAPFAQAALATYTSQAAWEATLVSGSNHTDTLESFVNGDAPSPDPLLLTFGSNGGALTGTNAIASFDPSKPGANAGRKSHSGSLFWEGGQSFAISFDTAVSAFSFWASDLGDFRADCPVTQTCTFDGAAVLKLVLRYEDGSGKSLDIAGAGGDTEEFFGFVDTGASKIVSVEFVNNTGTLDGQGFDDFTVGEVASVPPNPTPEPASLALMGLALAGLGVARRRRG